MILKAAWEFFFLKFECNRQLLCLVEKKNSSHFYNFLNQYTNIYFKISFITEAAFYWPSVEITFAKVGSGFLEASLGLELKRQTDLRGHKIW